MEPPEADADQPATNNSACVIGGVRLLSSLFGEG
jgi:hypothetical protein